MIKSNFINTENLEESDSIAFDASVGAIGATAFSAGIGKIVSAVSTGAGSIQSLWVPGAVSAAGVLTGGVGAGIAGALVRRNSKTAEGKALGMGMGMGGFLGTMAGISGLVLKASFIAKFSALIGGIGLYTFLYLLISGDLTGAKNKLEEKTDKEISEKIIEEFKNDQENIDKLDGKIKTIRV